MGFYAVLGLLFIIYLTFVFWWEVGKGVFGHFKSMRGAREDSEAHRAWLRDRQERRKKQEERQRRYFEGYPPKDNHSE